MNEKQYVVVRVESEHYAIEISKVNSITQMMEPTKVPNMAMYTEGVINLRGEVVPLVNFRKLFNVKGDYSKEGKIIVYKSDERSMGFLVDEASEVLTIHQDAIDDAKVILGNSVGDYISGIAKVNNRVIVILELEKIISQAM